MAYVATAPNDSTHDHSGTEIDDKEEEHQEEEIAKDSDSDATVTKDLGKVPGKYLNKISKIQKK
jgi:hypothetical protein